jgi:VanZ family protein
MKKNILKTIIILWMILIFTLSDQQADDSTKLSDGVIEKTIGNIYKTTHKNIEQNELVKIKEKYTHITRKTAHFTIYLILGLFVGLLLKEYNLETKKIIIYGIIICMLYAISDEIHQLFVSGRSGEIKDVLIDTCGSTVGLLIQKKTRILNKK